MTKKWCRLFILFYFILSAADCHNTMNMFFGTGNAVDMENPRININNYNHNDVVSGNITFTGDASDDMWVYKIELYYVGYAPKKDGSLELRDIKLKDKLLDSRKTHWEIDFDTSTLPDGSVVFKIKVIDDEAKYYFVNVTLQLDNHGPEMMISSPIGNDSNSPISNIFTCAVVPIELATNEISRIEWSLVNKDNPNIKCSGVEDFVESPMPSNVVYSFPVDPFDLTSNGYQPGFYNLHILGYSVPEGTTGELGVRSLNETISQDLYIDCTASNPKILITTPSSNDINAPSISPPQVVVSGAAVDDDGLAKIEFRWGAASSDEVIGVGEIEINEKMLSKSFVYNINGLTDGTFWVQARATDIKPNYSDWTEKSYFQIDSNYPRITWISPEQGSWHRGNDIQVKADIDIGEGAQITEVRFDFGEYHWDKADSVNIRSQDTEAKISLPANAVRFSRKILSNNSIYNEGGEFVYGLRAFKSDTEYTESSIVINVDKQPPDAAIKSPNESMTNLNQVILISGEAVDFANPGRTNPGIINDIGLKIAWADKTVVIPADEITGVAGWSYSFDTWAAGIGMTEGGENVSISFTARDIAGNETVVTENVIVDQSTDIPHVEATNFRSGDRKYGVFTVSGRAYDDDGVAKVQVFMTDNTTDETADILANHLNLLNGKVGVWQNCSGTDSWSYFLDLSSFSQGDYRFFYRSTDINGKHSTYGGRYDGVIFTIDPDLPQIDFALPEYLNSDATFQGTVRKLGTNSGVFVKRIRYRIAADSTESDWIDCTGDDVVFTDNRQTASFSIDYTQADIARYGQGNVEIYINAIDSTDRQNTAACMMFVDTAAVEARLFTPAKKVIRTDTFALYGSISDSEPSSGIYTQGTEIVYSAGTAKWENVADGASLASLSNIAYLWNISPTVADGIIRLKLISQDNALNGVANPQQAEINDIRLARYTPKFSGLTVNGLPVRNYMYIPAAATFFGTATDDNAYEADAKKGVRRICVYALDDAGYEHYDRDVTDDSAFVSLFDTSYNTATKNRNFTFTYEFSQNYRYILYRAYDKSGCWDDEIYQVMIDTVAPTAKFTYSSVGAVDAGGAHIYTNKTTYSDTLWIKLDAADRMSPNEPESSLVGTTVNVSVGTSAGGSDILPVKAYTVGSSIIRLDLKGVASDLYINYTIHDMAGNTVSSNVCLTCSAQRPEITCSLGERWLNGTALNAITAVSDSANVLYSLLDYDISDGAVNDLIYNTSMFDTNASDLIDFGTANSSIPLTDEQTFLVVLVAVDGDTNDTYETRSFIYDDTAPTFSVNVRENLGGVSGRADIVNSRLSGVVTFYGEFTDSTLGARENVADFEMKMTVDGVEYEITQIAKTDETDSDGYTVYTWSLVYDTTQHICANDVTYEFSLTDRAGNVSTVSKVYSIVPFIRSIIESAGSVRSVKMYGKSYDGAADDWCNVNYNSRYSYRLGSSNIKVTGFNLEGVSYRYNGALLSPSSASASGATLPKSGFAVSGELTAEINSTVSEPKNIKVFKNYGTNTANYNSIAEADAVLRDDNLFSLIYQKHTQDDGSYILRDYETAVGTFAVGNLAYGTTDLLTCGFNRFWFINVVKDRKSGLTAQSGLPDNKYYLLFGDSEFNLDLHAQKGVQLTGRFDGWQTLASVSKVWQSNQNIYMANTDWPVVYPDESKTPYLWGRWQKELIEYKNRWRMSAANDTSDGYDGGWNNPAANGGTSNVSQESSPRASNNPAGSADWSADWGDLVAYNNNIHTVWHSLYDNKTYYRMMTNAASKSVKSPSGGAVQFDVDGKYPAIAVDNSATPKPIIVCYDDNTRALKAFYAKSAVNGSTNMEGEESFTSYVIASGTGVGLYPKIDVDSDGHVHLFYQDGGLGALVYAYADSVDGLENMTKTVLDTDCAPGYYTDIRVNDDYVVCTYLSYGNIGTGEAIRVAKCPRFNVTDRSKWEIITVPCSNPIKDNKVRGYFDGNDSSKLALFGMSSNAGPQFFRQQ